MPLPRAIRAGGRHAPPTAARGLRVPPALRTGRDVSDRPLVALCTPCYSPTEPSARILPGLAVACRDSGMKPRIYAGVWRGEAPAGTDVVRTPLGVTTAARIRRFPRRIGGLLERHRMDCVVGLGSLPDADICIDGSQLTAGGRCVCLPPGVATPAASRRRTGSDVTFLMVGGDLAAQGVERLLVALGRLPAAARQRCQVELRGRLPRSFLRAAAVLGLADRVAPPLQAAPASALARADVVVDLSYRATANGWLFDAMAAGAAVLTHDGLQEADLVRSADAGVVLATPFDATACAQAVDRLLADTAQLRAWQANAARFGAAASRYGQVPRVMAAIARHVRHELAGGHAAVSA